MENSPASLRILLREVPRPRWNTEVGACGPAPIAARASTAFDIREKMSTRAAPAAA